MINPLAFPPVSPPPLGLSNAAEVSEAVLSNVGSQDPVSYLDSTPCDSAENTCSKQKFTFDIDLQIGEEWEQINFVVDEGGQDPRDIAIYSANGGGQNYREYILT